jgi:hypothetical protein
LGTVNATGEGKTTRISRIQARRFQPGGSGGSRNGARDLRQIRAPPPAALVLLLTMVICSKARVHFIFTRVDLHLAAAGRVASYHFIEKVCYMTKDVAPATSINIADMVTYGIVGCIALSFLVAFILWP